MKDPNSFNKDANQKLVAHYKEFRKSIEHGWFQDGLDFKLRKLVDARAPLTDEVLVDVMQAGVRAIELRRVTERWGRTQEPSSPEVYGTLFSYFSNVYVPLMTAASKGKFYPRLRELDLDQSLLPQIFLPPEVLQLTQSVLIRNPAGVLQAGQAAKQDPADPNDYGYVEPVINENLEALAAMLKSAAEEQAAIAKAMQDRNKLMSSRPAPPRYSRSRKALTEAQKRSRAAAYENYKKRLAEWEEQVRAEDRKFEAAKKVYEDLLGQRPQAPRHGRTNAFTSAATKKRIADSKAAHARRVDEWQKKVDEARIEMEKIKPSTGMLSWLGQKTGASEESAQSILEKKQVRLYAEAAKLTTVQLMIKQLYFYKEMIKDFEPYNMEQWGPTCRKEYKVLPDQLRFQYEPDDARWAYMEKHLAQNGLMFSERDEVREEVDDQGTVHEVREPMMNEDFANFYLNDRGRDPFKGNITGNMPFHMLRTAEQGVRYALGEEPMKELSDLKQPYLKFNWKDLGVPAFDDLRHFNDVLQVFLEEAFSKLENEEQVKVFNDVTQIMVAPQGGFPKRGEEESMEDFQVREEAFILASSYAGFTPYLAEKMQEMELEPEQWLRAVPRDVFFVWTENQIVMDFPPFYGPESYKQWALRNLYKALDRGQLKASTIKELCTPVSSSGYGTYTPYGYMGGSSAAAAALAAPKFSKDFCEKLSKRGGVEYLKDILRPFDDRSPYLPPVAAYDSDLRQHWGELRGLWKKFQSMDTWDEEEFPSKFNEWTFINTQFGQNPWIMLRISVMAKLWELENGTWTGKPKPESSTTKRHGRQRQTPAQLKAIHSRNALKKAFKKLPLADKDIAVQPMYANHVIHRNEEMWKVWKDAEEKRLFKLWEKIEHQFHQSNAYLYKLPTNRNRRSFQDTYGYLEILQRKALYTDDDVKRIINGFDLEQQGVDTSEMYELLDLAKNNENSQKFEVLDKILKSPGDTDKHERLLEEYLFENGDDETFATPKDVTLTFLRRQQDFQYPLMTQVVKSSAKRRIEELSKDLEKICKLDPDNDDDWDNLMSMTSKTQLLFNEHFKMEGIPESVTKFYTRTTKHDKLDYLFIGMMVIGFIGLMMSSAACASGILSVAGCPFAGVILTMMAGSTAGFIGNSIVQAVQKSDRMALGSRFKEMGFSDIEAVNRRRGRGWFGVAFEVVTGATMFVPIVLAGKVFFRTTVAALMRRSAIRKGVAKTVDPARTAFDIIEVQKAMKTAKLVETVPSTGRTISRVMNAVGKAAKPSTYKNWWAKNIVDDVVIDFTKETVDKNLGKVLADWFANSPKKFHTFLKKDIDIKFKKMDKLIEKAEKAISQAEKTKLVYGDTTFGPLRTVKWAFQPQHWFSKSQDKYVQKLAKYFNALDDEASLALIKKEVAKEKKIITAMMNDMGKPGMSLRMGEYMGKHMDTVAPILSDVIYKVHRIPHYLLYVMFFQGTPYAYPRFLKMGQWFSRRAFVKHVFASREKLLSQIMRKEATEFLGMGGEVMAVDMIRLLRAGQTTILAQSAELGAREADDVAKKLAQSLKTDWYAYRKEVAKRTFESKNPGVDIDALSKSILDEADEAKRAAKVDQLEKAVNDINDLEKLIFDSDVSTEVGRQIARNALKGNGWMKAGFFRGKIGEEKILDYRNYGESLDILMKRLSKDTHDLDSFSDYVQLTILKIKALSAKGRKTHEVVPY